MADNDDPRHRLRAWMASSPLVVPLVVVIVILVLGMLKVSGSSVALQSETDRSAELVGTPRPGRTDEYNARTALIIRQSKTDFPAETDLGIGIHDTGVLTDLPVADLSVVVKPHSWVYFALDVERAFAIEWWLTMLGPMLGVYALVYVIGRSRLVAALTGLAVAASPALLWWSIPSSGFSVMYSTLTGALLVAAIRAPGRRRFLWAALAAWTAAGFATLLYLPWLLPLGIVVAFVVISQLPNVLVEWRRLAPTAGAFGVVFGVLMAVYLRDHRIAIAAISDSVYPGHRVTVGGEAAPELVFGAPYDVFATSQQFVEVSGTNQSEAASGLMMWLPIAVVGGAFSGFRTRLGSARALTAAMIASVVLAAWALLPVPARIGSLLGLTNVQGSRLALPLTVAGIIAAGLYVQRLRDDPASRPSSGRVAIAAAAFLAVTGWVGTRFTIGGLLPSRTSLLALLVAFTVAVWMTLRGRAAVGLGALCALTLFGSARINPLQIGLSPILDNPLTAQIDDVRSGDLAARWAAIGESGHVASILMATGAPSATGTSWYADADTWRRIDLTGTQDTIWNRFAQIWIVVDDALPAPQLELRYNDLIVIHTPSCGGVLQQLEVRYTVSDTALPGASCLKPLSAADAPGERYLYEVVAPPA